MRSRPRRRSRDWMALCLDAKLALWNVNGLQSRAAGDTTMPFSMMEFVNIYFCYYNDYVIP